MPADFQLSLDISGDLEILDREGKVRKTFRPISVEAENAVSTLMGFAVQKTLLDKSSERGNSNGSGLFNVRTLPVSPASSCTASTWGEPEKSGIQMIPMCAKWRAGVKVSSDSPNAWYANALILSNDGSIQALLPSNSAAQLMNPGDRFVFPGVIEATPPVGILEHVIIFWTREPMKLALGQASDTKEELRRTYRALWLQVGSDDLASSFATVLGIEVKANDPFIEPAGTQISQREYTIPKFDVRPYLPEDKNTALYRVLEQANWLSNFSSSSGVGYKQHDWTGPDDVQNLRRGIDCSRAIWFTFTRAGLPYNTNNSYLSTAEMVSRNGPMHDQFETVSLAGPFEIGDVLVYRDETQGDGHVVMVIDSTARIAWGSHGYDGRVRIREVKEASIGVQYQKIRYKKDWLRWDRPNMDLVAVWRYRQFAREIKLPGGQPGLRALEHACDSSKQCGR
jgi:hypothetical protein